MFFIIYKTVASFVTFIILRSKVNTVGTIKELKEKRYIYKDEKKKKISSKEYVYVVALDYNGAEKLVEYSEIVSKKGKSEFDVNSTFKLYYNPKKNTVKNAAELKRALWIWPLATLFSAALLVLAMFLVALLQTV